MENTVFFFFCQNWNNKPLKQPVKGFVDFSSTLDGWGCLIRMCKSPEHRLVALTSVNLLGLLRTSLSISRSPQLSKQDRGRTEVLHCIVGKALWSYSDILQHFTTFNIKVYLRGLVSSSEIRQVFRVTNPYSATKSKVQALLFHTQRVDMSERRLLRDCLMDFFSSEITHSGEAA